MTRVRWTFVAVLAVGILACDDSTGPEAAEIQLNFASLSLEQLDSVQLIPSVVDAGGTLLSGVPVAFESTAPTIVSVSSVGVVKSLGPAGSGEIRVKGGGLTRAIPVTVTAVADSLVVAPVPLVIPQLGTVQINAKVIDRAGTEVPQALISYQTSHLNLITVSSTGAVTSVGPAGIATVTVASPGFGRVIPVAVTQVPTKLVLTPATLRVSQGRTLRLSPSVLDAVSVPILGFVFQYTSLSPALISVSSDGIVTSLGPLGTGMLRIAALGSSLTTDVPITVQDFGSPTGDSLQLISSPLMYAVSFLNSERLAAGSYASAARLFDLRSSTSSVIGPQMSYGVAAAASRNTIYFASDGLIEHNLTTNAVRNAGIPGQLFDIVLSADELTAYVGTAGNVIHVVNLITMTVTKQIDAPRGGLHLALAPSGAKIYASSGGDISETDVATGVSQIIQPGFYQALAVTSDGRTLYGVSEGGSILARDLTSQQTRTFQTPGCGGWGMALTPDDERLVVSCPLNGRIIIVDASTGAALRTFPGGEPRRVALSADGYVAAVGSSGGVVIIR